MSTTRLEIDLAALRHNYTYIRSKLGQDVKCMAVVKAFAYGSDSCAVAKELVELGVDYFAVAYTSEGVVLRKAGIQTPILVLHPQPDSFEDLINHCLEPSIYSKRVLSLFTTFTAGKKQSNYPIHIKFNTGLNRLGFHNNEVSWIIDHLSKSPSLKVQSLFSHLVASEDLLEKKFTENQIIQFDQIATTLFNSLDYRPFLHMTNTSGILNYPEAHYDCVRFGIGLYGYGNTKEETLKLRAVASLKTIISQIHTIKTGESVGYNRAFIAQRELKTATLPIGHADGISRSFGNGVGFVTINGQKASIIGNVCMDMLMIDITQINCEEGDEVEIFGHTTNAEELSEKIHSISYELLTAIGQRVKRVILR